MIMILKETNNVIFLEYNILSVSSSDILSLSPSYLAWIEIKHLLYSSFKIYKI